MVHFFIIKKVILYLVLLVSPKGSSAKLGLKLINKILVATKMLFWNFGEARGFLSMEIKMGRSRIVFTDYYFFKKFLKKWHWIVCFRLIWFWKPLGVALCSWTHSALIWISTGSGCLFWTSNLGINATLQEKQKTFLGQRNRVNEFFY